MPLYGLPCPSLGADDAGEMLLPGPWPTLNHDQAGALGKPDRPLGQRMADPRPRRQFASKKRLSTGSAGAHPRFCCCLNAGRRSTGLSFNVKTFAAGAAAKGAGDAVGGARS